MTDLQYPIGPFQMEGSLTEEQRRVLIRQIAEAPGKLRAAVQGLSIEQLETPYREGGWTVRQVVHHVADSHLNSFVRWKLALTETEPTIKPYDQALWAETVDVKKAPVEISLALLDALHHRWVLLLQSLTSADFARKFQHPEQGLVTLERTLAMYAWHGRHHVAHIAALRERMGWR